MIALGERFEPTACGGVIAEHDAAVARHPARLPRRVPLHARRRRAPAARQRRPATTSSSAFIHLYALNRGILMTPFHNMALMSPATTEADVDRHTGRVRRDGDRAHRLTEPSRGQAIGKRRPRPPS